MTSGNQGKHSKRKDKFFDDSSSTEQRPEAIDPVLSIASDEEAADSDLLSVADPLSDPEDALFAASLPVSPEDIDNTDVDMTTNDVSFENDENGDATAIEETADTEESEPSFEDDEDAPDDKSSIETEQDSADTLEVDDDDDDYDEDDVDDDVLDDEADDLDPAAEEDSGVSKWSRHLKNSEQEEQGAEFDLGPKNHKALWITLASIFGVLLIAYVGASIFFMSHFGFNTSINDVDCSFKTVEEAQALIKEHVTNYELKVIERNNAGEAIKGSAINLQYSDDDRVDSYLENQNSFAWPVRLFNHEAPGEQRVTVTYDEAKLTTNIAALACMNPATMAAPVDAFAEFNGTEYVIHAESLGTTLDSGAVTTTIAAAIADTENSVNLDKAGCYVAPKITSESKELAEKIKLYNTYIPFSITYTFGNATEVISGDAVIAWFTIAADGSAALNEDAVRAWVEGFASRHDTVGTTREFLTHDGIPASVSGGIYGWKIDQDAEVTALVEACTAKTSQVREPHYTSTAASHTGAEWGTSYIDLNLSEQHMWLIIDGAVVFDADVVTGLPTPKKETPEGVWMILEMARNKTLRGEQYPDGSYEYETPVAYWMRMTWSGCGFHDATWQPYFGGSRYLSNGSHGCINMSYSDARELYSLVWVDLPVVCHY